MVGGVNNQPLLEVPLEFSTILSYTCIVSIILTMLGSIGFVNKDSKGGMYDFYTRWERYSQHSFFSYFARELFRFLRAEVMVVGFCIIAIVYWVTLGGALIAFVMIPFATIVSFMVGLYKIAQRSAHWWCFGITLTVTTVSAIIFYNNFDNEVLLWSVALVNGVVSGFATEGLQRLGTWWGNTKRGNHFLMIWDDDDKIFPFSLTAPVWKGLNGVFEKVTGKVFAYVI
jgi:hypothetical protein